MGALGTTGSTYVGLYQACVAAAGALMLARLRGGAGAGARLGRDAGFAGLDEELGGGRDVQLTAVQYSRARCDWRIIVDYCVAECHCILWLQ